MRAAELERERKASKEDSHWVSGKYLQINHRSYQGRKIKIMFVLYYAAWAGVTV